MLVRTESFRKAKAAGFAPSDFGTVLAWWDVETSDKTYSSGSIVEQLDDKSGNGHHLSQSTVSQQGDDSTRTVGGRAAIELVDTSDTMYSTTAMQIPNQGAIVLVLTKDENDGKFQTGWGASGASDAGVGLIGKAGIDGQARIADGVDGQTASTDNNLAAGSSYIVMVSWDVAANEFVVRANGLENNAGLAAAIDDVGTKTTFWWGTLSGNTSLSEDGAFAETIVYSTFLNATQRADLEAELNDRYGTLF